MKHLSTSLRDFVEFVALPGSLALCPWRYAFPLSYYLSRREGLFGDKARTALKKASIAVPIDNTDEWLRRYRRTLLIDYADLHLSRLRGDEWMDRHMVVEGDPWPGHACLILTMHWGAGIWMFRYLRRMGERVALLHGEPEAHFSREKRVRLWYARRRVREVARCGGAASMITGGVSARHFARAIASGTSVLAGFDVPPGGMKSTGIEVLGRAFHLPRGLFRLAAAQRIPVMFMLMGVDWHTGKRVLRFKGPLYDADESSLITEAGQTMEQALRADSASWHLWPVADLFLDGPNGPGIRESMAGKPDA